MVRGGGAHRRRDHDGPQLPAARSGLLRLPRLRARGRGLHGRGDRAHPDDQAALMADEKPTPEIRLDQLTGLRTILSPARADRPFDFGGTPTEENSEAREKCPFCEGREDRTPPEAWADRPGGGPADSPGWRSRAVPNLYPALAQTDEPSDAEADEGVTPAGDPLRAASRGREPDLFKATVATGHHEVIVNSPQHHTSLGQLDDAELSAAVAGWRARMSAH